MVDLVKIRQKAKEKKEAEDALETVSVEEETAKPSPDSAPKKKKRASARKAKAPDKKPAAPETPDDPAIAVEAPAEETSAEPLKEVKKAPAKAEERERTPPAAKQLASEPVVEKPSPETTPAPASVEKHDSPEEEPPAAAPSPPIEEVVVDEESLDRLEKFKREAGKRRTWIADATRGAAAVAEDEESGDLELLRFRLAGEEYAVDIEKIVEIVPPRGTTRVPNADPTIVGIMSLRGTIVTVFDLRRKLGHPPIAETEGLDPRMIVVEREGETAGFLVDKVSRVVKLDPSEIENHPVVSAAEQSDYVGGVFQATDGLVILLDLEKILASHS